MKAPPVCYCGARMDLRGGVHGSFWRCTAPSCTGKARAAMNGDVLGAVSDQRTRDARTALHAAFNPLWRDVVVQEALGQGARTVAYRWLSEAAALGVDRVHFGSLDAATCMRAVQACERQTPAGLVQWARQRGWVRTWDEKGETGT